MDIVYINKFTEDDNIELRYSLRSIKNIKDFSWKVYIIWDKPSWCDNVIHIQTEYQWNRELDVLYKQQIIVYNTDISDDFIFMNDDFFVLKPTRLKYYKTWTHEEYLKEKINDILYESDYYNNIKYVYKIFWNIDNFETHTPIIYNKEKLRLLINKYFDYKSTILRSLYCNEYNITWYKLRNTYNYWDYKNIVDCKCYKENKLKVLPKQEFLSTDNNCITFNTYKYLDNIFKDISKYENSFNELKLLWYYMVIRWDKMVYTNKKEDWDVVFDNKFIFNK